jgi:8-oxo-dGTP pyrophosphatase MutT (NUDIX family)
MKEAVCALIFRDNGKILGVSRKDDLSQMGLIGGKVDDGETREQALLRETLEETGLRITHYKKIFENIDGEFNTFTYLCKVEGEVTTSEKGVVKELTWKELFNGPFGEYNKALHESLQWGATDDEIIEVK